MQKLTRSVQEKLFQQIQEILNKEKPVKEILELIPQSPSSVYKKLNLQRPLTVEDLIILCQHYDLSVDELLKDGKPANL